jgi:hypothetical protein
LYVLDPTRIGGRTVLRVPIPWWHCQRERQECDGPVSGAAASVIGGMSAAAEGGYPGHGTAGGRHHPQFIDDPLDQANFVGASQQRAGDEASFQD